MLRRVRNWAAQVGEIKVGEEADPTVTLQLSGVDTEGILANAQAVDNPGNRRRKVREMLFEQLGIEDRDDLFLEHEILWRGTRRSFQVIFGNVRELTNDRWTTKGGSRKAGHRLSVRRPRPQSGGGPGPVGAVSAARSSPRAPWSGCRRS